MKFWEVARDLYQLRKKEDVKQNLASATFHEWSEVTTAHGFLDLSRAKTLVGKIIWAFLITICLVIMCYQVSNGIRDFSEHQWATASKQKPRDDGEFLI